MKILEIRLKNLNSLVGEWVIDLTEPDYVANGLFALTGPTGAGKSTILDAMCLALYGQTPRLGKVNQSANEIMSRQSGECYAEVLFETQKGTYRCHWEQHRARKKAGAPLQGQAHEIVEAITGKPIVTKKSEVPKAVEDVTGMDFDRFTRSMLLAQGSFDSFLKADTENKSKILEQITGTMIYTDISKMVHECFKVEEGKENLLKAEVAGIKLLTDEEEIALQTKIATQKVELEKSKKAHEAIKLAFDWVVGIEKLEGELVEIERNAALHRAKKEAFIPEALTLAKAQKAADIEGDYVAKVSLIKEEEKDQARLSAMALSLPALKDGQAKSEKALVDKTTQKDEATKALECARPLFEKVRGLDHQIAQSVELLKKEREAMEGQEKVIEGLKGDLASLDKVKKDQEASLLVTSAYLKEHAKDEALMAECSGLKEKVAAFENKRKDMSALGLLLQKEGKGLEAEKALMETQKAQLAQREANFAIDQAKLASLKAQVLTRLDGKLLREYSDEKKARVREATLIRTIMSLEEHRAHLVDGEPCPLCGATEHPFALGNIPVIGSVEKMIASLEALINEVDGLNESIKLKEEKERESERLLHKMKEVLEATKASFRAKEAHYEEKQSRFDGIKAALTLDFEALKGLFARFGLTLTNENEPLDRIEALEKRAISFAEHQALLRDQDAAIKATLASIATKGEVIESKKASLKERVVAFNEAQKATAALKEERHRVFADRDPKVEENAFVKKAKEAEALFVSAQRSAQEAKGKLEAATVEVGVIEKRQAARLDAMKAASDIFAASLTKAGFESEGEFLAAKRSTEEREALLKTAKALENEGTVLTTMKKDRSERLLEEKQKALTEEGKDTLEIELTAAQEKCRLEQEALTTDEVALKQNATQKVSLKDQMAAIEKQKLVTNRWRNLHALIGSNDGKKFRNFAQGLTFELMVAHANKELAKMSDRYLLVRGKDEPLSLNVIDNYQAGEVRSTQNLSGGESFIVSLTLALGLSKMASKKVRVDSLFLDEGFGSLDEDTLETALEALGNLQQDGKLIGVISHVKEMNERISTQIHVRPTSGGHSVIEGPGCRRV